MKAAIRINADERLGRINPNIYGVMFENCGRCVYDGLWVGEDSDVPNWKGIRLDVLGLLKSMRTPIVRWPGGTPSDRHHWRNGVGPRERRPRSLIAGGEFTAPPETYAFATDEYIMLAREVNFQPYICANVGTGTAEEAAQWVEYCNVEGDTTFAALRKANGHPEPHGVKLWGIGNECYFWHDAKDYAKVIRHYSRLMKHVDPTIKLVAAGLKDADDWNRTILEEAGDSIDYISLHFFYGDRVGLAGGPTTGYQEHVAAPLDAERAVRRLDTLIGRATGSDRIRIVVDEWEVWHAEAVPDNGAEQNLSLTDALFAAGMFHMLHRTRDRVDMGIVANLVNSTNMVLTRGDQVCLSPAYHALELYATRAGDVALNFDVDVDTYRVDSLDEAVPLLDCSATRSDERQTVALSVVNRSREDDIDSTIALGGCSLAPEGRVCRINGDGVDAKNDFNSPDNVLTVERPLPHLAEKFTHTFPAHSITLIEIPTA